MRRFLSECSLVARRELGALVVSPLLYILCGLFFLLSGYTYLSLLVAFAQDSFRDAANMESNITQSVIRQTFYSVHFFLLAQVPLLTMRVFAEDRAVGTLDLLQTTPLRDWALVIGKFIGCIGGLGIYLALTLAFPIATSLVSKPEWPVIFGGIVALVLSAGAYTAVGLFFSSITESQVVASVMSYVFLFFLVMLSTLADLAGKSPLADAARHFAVAEHIDSFLKGSVNAMDVVYFVLMAALFLFLTARVLESRRWRA